MFLLRNITVIVLFFIQVNVIAQENESFFTFLPDGYLYNRNPANTLESKIGFDYTYQHNKIYLNIGATKEIIRAGSCDCNQFSLGAEFFTWTLLRGEADFKFPVMAVDYFFGIFLSNRFIVQRTLVSSRLRLSHISAHLADGSWDEKDSLWLNNLTPFVYSREFIEYSLNLDFNFIKPYFGITYIYHVKPNTTGKFIFSAGTELELFKFNGLSVYSAFDIKYYKKYIDEYQYDLNSQVGIKIGKSYFSNIRIYLDYYHGTNINGPYSFSRIEQTQFGFYLFI